MFFLLLGSILMLHAQTLDYKGGYQFPTTNEDAVLTGLRNVRGMDYHDNPLGDGTSAFAVTNYNDRGHVHVLKNIGDDAFELVWTSPLNDTTTGSVAPRYVTWGDLDNDGNIEIVAPMDRNGIVVYEWDGVAGSFNFGDAPALVIGTPVYPVDSAGTYSRVEYCEIGDFDGDGQNELSVAVNASNSAFDRYYIFSVDGEFEPGEPGFSVVNRENAIWAKGVGVYGVYGGGSPYAMIAANLDGEGNDEILIHAWNYGHATPVRVPDANTYVLADTTGLKAGKGKHYIYTTKPTDAVSLGGGTAVDVDGDGREEVYIPLFDSIKPNVIMIHYEDGDNTAIIDSSNFMLMDITDFQDTKFDLFGRAGYGDFDNDGKTNLYFAGRHDYYVMSSEFQGGDKLDPANWVNEILYTGDELDSLIYHTMTITDSLGTRDTAYTYTENFDGGTIAMKLYCQHTDADRDGYQDIIMPSQTWLDSVAVTVNTWNADSLKYFAETYNVLEPNRISIRFLESNTLYTGIEAKEATVISPDMYRLEQNYPNPFNPTTNIQFFLPINKQISLIVYNSLGQKVKTLINNELYISGDHQMAWDGTNESGVKAASGVYVYELRYGNFKQTRKMTLVK